MEEGLLRVHPHCLMIFIDETGHEEFADKSYPIFGYAGCAVIAAAARSVIVDPWRAMKARHFGGADVQLHASSLRDPTQEQLTALETFFRSQPFGRFGAVMTVETELPESVRPLNLMPGILRARWAELASRCMPPPAEMALLFESSRRLDPFVERYFGMTNVQVNGVSITVHHGFIEKRHHLEELEVADFIAQAAGAQAKRDLGEMSGYRKDFQAVFQAKGDWSSFITVNRALLGPGAAPPPHSKS